MNVFVYIYKLDYKLVDLELRVFVTFVKKGENFLKLGVVVLDEVDFLLFGSGKALFEMLVE